LLFNNRIYGLTKGQYSPTSELGKVTKSTPAGSVDAPFNPIALALGADATFVARSVDVEGKHLQSVVRQAYEHRGTSFVEILQNCNIFNDGAFESLTDRRIKADHQLVVEHGKPMLFGSRQQLGIRMTAAGFQIVDLEKGEATESEVLIHDQANPQIAHFLATAKSPTFPTALGVLHARQRSTYEELCHEQIAAAKTRGGASDLDSLLNRGDTWTVA